MSFGKYQMPNAAFVRSDFCMLISISFVVVKTASASRKSSNVTVMWTALMDLMKKIAIQQKCIQQQQSPQLQTP